MDDVESFKQNALKLDWISYRSLSKKPHHLLSFKIGWALFSLLQIFRLHEIFFWECRSFFFFFPRFFNIFSVDYFFSGKAMMMRDGRWESSRIKYHIVCSRHEITKTSVVSNSNWQTHKVIRMSCKLQRAIMSNKVICAVLNYPPRLPHHTRSSAFPYTNHASINQFAGEKTKAPVCGYKSLGIT